MARSLSSERPVSPLEAISNIRRRNETEAEAWEGVGGGGGGIESAIGVIKAGASVFQSLSHFNWRKESERRRRCLILTDGLAGQTVSVDPLKIELVFHSFLKNKIIKEKHYK